jgi:hypothetical protein
LIVCRRRGESGRHFVDFGSRMGMVLILVVEDLENVLFGFLECNADGVGWDEVNMG